MTTSEVRTSDGTRVLLVGHGSATEPTACRSVMKHAEAIRSSDNFDEVLTAFISGGPSVATAMRSIDEGIIVVVPLLMSEGHFANDVIPHEIESHLREGLSVRYTPPVGTHPVMTKIVFDRAASAVKEPREGIGVALIGHGNDNRSGAASAVRYHAERLRSLAVFDEIHGVYLEQSPRICRLHEVVNTAELVVVPLFMAEGHHDREDLPSQLGMAWDGSGMLTGHRVWLTKPAGTDPLVGTIALERALSVLDEGGEVWAQTNQSAGRIQDPFVIGEI